MVSEVDVWRVELDLPSPPDFSWLPAEERERGARLRPGRGRERWLASRAALRRVLARYLAREPGRIEIGVGSRGKPMLADPAATLRFNLSHSGGLALIAVGDGVEVGIDVEERRGGRDFLRLAELGLEPADAAHVREAPPELRADAFYVAWVRREAVAKCLGTGLAWPLPEAAPVAVRRLEAGGAHAAALAVAGRAAPSIRRRFAEELSLCSAGAGTSGPGTPVGRPSAA
jgi:4'-phosphopantetheinyl transferase